MTSIQLNARDSGLRHNPPPWGDDMQTAFFAEVRQGIPIWVRTLLTQAIQDMESAQQSNAVAGDRQFTLPAVQLLRRNLVSMAEKVVLELEKSLDRRGPLASPALGGQPKLPTAARLSLSLLDETQIDLDIEIGRLVQCIEAVADLELKHLAAMCAGMLGHGHVDPQSLPLPPSVCAQALHAGVQGLTTNAGLRAMLLRQLGVATGQQMKHVYAAQAEYLNRRGVLPAVFRLMPCADEVGVTPVTPVSPDSQLAEDEAHRPALQASLKRLVALAQDHAEVDKAEPAHAVERQAAALGAPATPDQSSDDLIRLIEPLPMQSPATVPRTALKPSTSPSTRRQVEHVGPAPLDHHAAKRLMQRFLDHIEAKVLLSDTGLALLLGLREPALALAVAEPRLWQTLDHPWWSLLDHVMAGVGIQDADTSLATDPVTEALCRVVRGLQPGRAAERKMWQNACAEVQAAVDRVVQERLHALAPVASGLQSQVDREELEFELRNQIVQQLRSTPVSPPLRRFLLDHWTLVLTQAAVAHGAHSQQLAQLALVVDDLIKATHQSGKRVSAAQRAVLLRQAREGLGLLGWLAEQLEAELKQLGHLLDNPPPAEEEDWSESATSLPTPWTLDLNASLPTVPLDMNQLPVTGALPASQAWIQSLEPGAHCRLFLLGRWMTAQLSWVSDTRNLFLFNSRHGGRVHSLTKRMLQKLREAGLAASIEDGLLVAQAMDSLVDTNFSAG